MVQNSLLRYRYHTMPHKLNKITIHLIEDDISQRDSIESLLVYKGYIVKSYSAANNFLKNVPFERPAIIIADIQLPDLSGVDLHRILMEKYYLPNNFYKWRSKYSTKY